MSTQKMTVRDLKRRLESWEDDWEIQFSGLTFNRLKERDTKMVNMEFCEIYRVIDDENDA